MLWKQCESLILNSFTCYLMLPELDPRELWWAQACAMEIFRPVRNKLGLRRPSANYRAKTKMHWKERLAHPVQWMEGSHTYTDKHTISSPFLYRVGFAKCLLNLKNVLKIKCPKGLLQSQVKTWWHLFLNVPEVRIVYDRPASLLDVQHFNTKLFHLHCRINAKKEYSMIVLKIERT